MLTDALSSDVTEDREKIELDGRRIIIELSGERYDIPGCD